MFRGRRVAPAYLPCVSQEHTGNGKWCGCATASNGDVYCCPRGVGSLLVIQPSGKNFAYVNLPAPVMSLLSSFSHTTFDTGFDGFVAAMGGKFYFAPVIEGWKHDYGHFRHYLSSSSRDRMPLEAFDREPSAFVLIFDPETQSFSHIVKTVPGLESCRGVTFGGAADGGNGKIYCPPGNGNFVAVINTCQEDVTFMTGVGRATLNNKWTGIELARDGYTPRSCL